MRTGYAWYRIAADWLAKKSTNNLSTPLAGALSPGSYSGCKVTAINKNKITVLDSSSNKEITSSLFSLPFGLKVGDSVDIRVGLYGDYIIQIDGQGDLRAVDPDSKKPLHNIAAPSIGWIHEWAQQKGLKEQRPVIVAIRIKA